jgi:hypothetical protein
MEEAAQGISDDGRRERARRVATGRCAAIDARADEEVDLAVLSRNVAARLDSVLAARSPTQLAVHVRAEREHAVRAWSTVVAGPGDASSRRDALATTVLRIGSGGGLDAVDGAEAQGVDAVETAPSPEPSTRTVRERANDTSNVVSAQPDDAPPSVQLEARVERGRGTAEPGVRDDAHTNERLAAVRRRMATRRAADGSPLDRMALFRRRGVRRALQRLLIVAAIIGATAVVSLLVT